MNFRRMRLRGDSVFALCDEAGNLVVDQGKVEIRYRPEGKPYRAFVANLTDDAGEGEPSDARERAPKKKRAPTSDAPRAPASSGARAHGRPIEPFARGAVVAYADGACKGNPGPAGLGVVLFANGKIHELSEYLGRGTNNVGELTAILRAAEATHPSASLMVHTDSQYSIGVLSGRMRAKANRELIDETRAALKRLAKHSLHYVPGHSGHEWNERADRLAVMAVERRATTDWTHE
jgi:ribonuclease HI